MPPKAILLGSIRTLGETSDLHRRAFNAAFSEAGLGWSWSVDDYRKIMTGPDERGQLAEHAARRGVEIDAGLICRRKDEVLNAMLEGVRVPRRPGLESLIGAARRAGLKLGLVTTASPQHVAAMLAVTGTERETFAFVGDGAMVTRPKPAPDIYLAALDALEITPAEAIAIEERTENAAAATAAGIACVAFPGTTHLGGDLRLDGSDDGHRPLRLRRA